VFALLRDATAARARALNPKSLPASLSGVVII